MPTVPLREFVQAILVQMDLRYQQRFDAQQKALDAALLSAEKAVQTALTAAEKAVVKAEVAAEKRFDAVNEFRGAYQDIINLQMPRAEAEQRLTQLLEQINELKLANSTIIGHSTGATDSWKLVIGIVGFLAAVGTVISIVIALTH